jgi:hypothetical protein
VATGWTVRGSNPGGGEIFRTGPEAHPASCAMGTGSFPGVKSSRGVTLNTYPLLMLWSRKGRAIPLPPYGPYGLHRASVPVQGCTFTSVPVQGCTFTSVPVQGCTFTLSLLYALCILRLSNVDGRVTGEMWVRNYLGEGDRGLFDVLSRNLLGTERNISLYMSIATQIQTRHFSITIPKFYNHECRTELTSINMHNTSPICQNYSTPKPQFRVKISPHTSVKLV